MQVAAAGGLNRLGLRGMGIECGLGSVGRENVAPVMRDRSLGLINHGERIRQRSDGPLSDGWDSLFIRFPTGAGVKRRRCGKIALSALPGILSHDRAHAGKIVGDSAC